MSVNRLQPWYDVKRDFGAKGDNSTDDTSAIQNALNQVAADNGGAIFFPPGIYLVNGSLTTQPNSTGESSILYVPMRTGLSSSAPMTVRLTGSTPSANIQWGGSGLVPALGMAIIKSTQTDSGGSGAGSILASPAPNNTTLVSTNNAKFTAVNVVVDGLQFQTYDNPNLSCLNLRHAVNCAVRSCTFLAIGAAGPFAEPTHANSVALALPLNGNGAVVLTDDITISGYYTGIEDGEHHQCTYANIAACKQAITFPDRGHASHYCSLLTQSCLSHLVFTGATRVIIDLHDVEHYASGDWSAGGNIIEDPINYGHGLINHYSISGDSGYPVNGGSNLVLTAIT